MFVVATAKRFDRWFEQQPVVFAELIHASRVPAPLLETPAEPLNSPKNPNLVPTFDCFDFQRLQSTLAITKMASSRATTFPNLHRLFVISTGRASESALEHD